MKIKRRYLLLIVFSLALYTGIPSRLINIDHFISQSGTIVNNPPEYMILYFYSYVPAAISLLIFAGLLVWQITKPDDQVEKSSDNSPYSDMKPEKM